jgi:hypothetical protein
MAKGRLNGMEAAAAVQRPKNVTDSDRQSRALRYLAVFPWYLLYSSFKTTRTHTPMQHPVSARFSPLYLILPHLSIIYIILYPLYPLWDPLITLSKYIHV